MPDMVPFSARSFRILPTPGCDSCQSEELCEGHLKHIYRWATSESLHEESLNLLGRTALQQDYIRGMNYDDFRTSLLQIDLALSRELMLACRDSQPLDFLARSPDGGKYIETQDAASTDPECRPEIYVLLLGSRDGTRFVVSQIRELINELDAYIAGVGSPAFARRACRSRQTDKEGERIAKVDGIVPGTWDCRRSARTVDSERRYILDYADCKMVQAFVGSVKQWLPSDPHASSSAGTRALPSTPAEMMMLLAEAARQQPRTDQPEGTEQASESREFGRDLVLAMGATTRPCQARLRHEQHAHSEVLLQLIDAACKVLFPGTGFGVHYISLRLVHRPELLPLALFIDSALVSPMISPLASEIVDDGWDDEDLAAGYARNFDTLIRQGNFPKALADAVKMQKKKIKKAYLNKVEHDLFMEVEELTQKVSKLERKFIELSSA